MALINCSFYSEVLGFHTSMTVILPQSTKTQYGVENIAVRKQLHPTLYLLHGLSDDNTNWLRRTSIERYVAPLGLAVVMPQVQRSFYTDMAHGYNYWTFVTEELPMIARDFFPLSPEREHNFVAGLSMGGYGAFKWALSHPDRIAAAASLSGAVNMANPYFREDMMPLDYKLIYGEADIKGTRNDLFHLLAECGRKEGAKPKLYQCCGTEDFLYEDNVLFRDAAQQTALDYTYEEGPGTHDWAYWDARIQDVLRWLPLNNEEQA
ncbi:alpha/beta hydrolase [Paenibacillus apiarius]|uniref:alpha/beta hydrolase n=1 Tax=Paenibacillus apiarius TaxID=46240 RepID=UPI003B3BE193